VISWKIEILLGRKMRKKFSIAIDRLTDLNAIGGVCNIAARGEVGDILPYCS
jgi:hypothetical protein